MVRSRSGSLVFLAYIVLDTDKAICCLGYMGQSFLFDYFGFGYTILGDNEDSGAFTVSTDAERFVPSLPAMLILNRSGRDQVESYVLCAAPGAVCNQV